MTKNVDGFLPATTQPDRFAQSVAAHLGRISEITDAQLQSKISGLADFVIRIEGLIGADEKWQRELRRQIVAALTRVPYEYNINVPQRRSLRVLHSVICKNGPMKIMELVLTNPDVPSWTDMIRLHIPDYARGNVETLSDHHEKVQDAVNNAKSSKSMGSSFGRRTQMTVGAYRTRLFELKADLARVEVIVHATAGMSPRSQPSTTVLKAARLAGDLVRKQQGPTPLRSAS